MLIMDLEMVCLAVSSVPKEMGSAVGRRMLLYDAVLASRPRRGVGTVMSLGVKAGLAQKQEDTLLVLMSVMQAKTLAS